jgi:hypothetical protein
VVADDVASVVDIYLVNILVEVVESCIENGMEGTRFEGRVVLVGLR